MSKQVMHMAAILQACRCKLQVFLSDFCCVEKRCCVSHLPATASQQIMLPAGLIVTKSSVMANCPGNTILLSHWKIHDSFSEFVCVLLMSF